MGTTTKEIGGSSFNDMISSVDRRSEYVENRSGANVRLNNFLTPYTLDDKSSILNAPCGYSNGVYASLRPVATYGAELVTNGDFSNGTNNWTPNTNATLSIDNSKLKVAISGAASGYPSQNITTVVGKKYNITADAFIGTATKVSLYSAAFGFNDLTADGSYNLTFTATSTSTQIRLYVYGDGTYGLWDNISVKEVTDADFEFTRGSAATRVTKDGLVKNVQILSDDLVQNGDFSQIGSEEVTNGNFSQIGSELITNGDFATDSNWTKDTGTTISGGNANFVNATTVSLYQNIGTQSGIVKVEFTVTNYTSGTLNVYSGGNQSVGVVNVSANALGLYTAYVIRTGGNVNIIFGSNNNFTGSIDNVSVKEVGQDWTFSSGASMGDDIATIIGDGTSFTSISQSNVFTVGKLYKVTLDAVINSGLGLKVQDGSTNENFGAITTSGTYTFYGKANNANLVIGRRTGGTAFDSYVDNVSVKEVGQNWSFGTGWSMGDGKAIKTGTVASNFDQLNTGVFTNNKTYKITFNISNSNNGRLLIYIGGNSVTIDITNATNGTHTFYGIADGEDYLIFRNDTSGFEGSIDNVSVVEVTDDTDLPRIDYTSGTGSLLLEPQSTNLFIYSQDFTNSYWIHNADITVTNSSELAPNGELDAHLIEYDGGGYSFIRVGISAPSTAATLSVFAKKGNWRYLGFRNFQTVGNDHTVFDFDTETFPNINAGQTASFEIFPNGWYRIKVTQPSPGASSFAGFAITDSTGSELNTTGGQVANVHLFGAQLELLSYATSYIPTSGSTVTRNADLCINAGSSDLINSTEGVLYAEVKAFEVQPDFFISMNDGTQNNRVIIKFSESVDNQLTAFTINSTNSSSITHTISNFKQYNKIALSYSSLYLKLYVNGQEVGTSVANPNLAVGLNVLNLSNQPTDKNVKGNVKSVAVFKEALTDEELAKITSTTQQEAFYEMRDKMLQINADYYEFGDYTTRLKKLF